MHPQRPARQHHRRSIRLTGHDYAQPAAYFVTVVTRDRICVFDNAVLRGVAETAWRSLPRHFPDVTLDEWVVMPNHVHGIVVIGGDADGAWGLRRGEAFANARLNAKERGTSPDCRHGNKDLANASPLQGPSDHHASPSPLPWSSGDNASALHWSRDARPCVSPQSGSLGAIIATFKSMTTRRINAVRKTQGATTFQRNYYEHIVRDEQELARIREYIANNPFQWESDPESPANTRQP